jgi:hypothetical protein
MAHIQTEFEYLEVALVFAESQEDPYSLLRLLTALTGYYEIWGQYQHGMRWYDIALERPGAPDLLATRALWGGIACLRLWRAYGSCFPTCTSRLRNGARVR